MLCNFGLPMQWWYVEGSRRGNRRDLMEIPKCEQIVPTEEAHGTVSLFLVAQEARRGRQMAAKRSQEIIWHHGQLIDERTAEVLVPGEKHIDVGVVQGLLAANTEITSSVDGVASHGMCDSVLEGNAEELVFMPSMECFQEDTRDTFEHSAFACPRGAVAQSEERSLGCGATWISLGQWQAFVFEPKICEHALGHSIEDCELLACWSFFLALHLFHPC